MTGECSNSDTSTWMPLDFNPRTAESAVAIESHQVALGSSRDQPAEKPEEPSSNVVVVRAARAGNPEAVERRRWDRRCSDASRLCDPLRGRVAGLRPPPR